MSHLVAIDDSVTEEQRNDPRFHKLLRDCEEGFSAASDVFKLLIGLHEAAHAYCARKAGAKNIRYRGPTLMWDDRFDCPAISRSATIYTPDPNCNPIAEVKASIAGFICRREMSGSPNDQTAIESDLESCRKWFYKNVTDDEVAFNAAVQQAEREILIDLRSPKIRHDLWDEARNFVAEIFPADSN